MGEGHGEACGTMADCPKWREKGHRDIFRAGVQPLLLPRAHGETTKLKNLWAVQEETQPGEDEQDTLTAIVEFVTTREKREKQSVQEHLCSEPTMRPGRKCLTPACL